MLPFKCQLRAINYKMLIIHINNRFDKHNIYVWSMNVLSVMIIGQWSHSPTQITPMSSLQLPAVWRGQDNNSSPEKLPRFSLPFTPTTTLSCFISQPPNQCRNKPSKDWASFWVNELLSLHSLHPTENIGDFSRSTGKNQDRPEAPRWKEWATDDQLLAVIKTQLIRGSCMFYYAP